jgi:hypothetical protein
LVLVALVVITLVAVATMETIPYSQLLLQPQVVVVVSLESTMQKLAVQVVEVVIQLTLVQQEIQVLIHQ